MKQIRGYTRGYWKYMEYVPEGVTINGKEYLITPEGGVGTGKDDIALVRREADAKIITEAPIMYGLLFKLEEYFAHEVKEGSIRAKIPLGQIQAILNRVAHKASASIGEEETYRP